MPKPILKALEKVQQENLLTATPGQQKMTQMNKQQLDRLLRKLRSKEYMEILHKLDAGGHVHNQQKVNEIIEIICNEFPEVDIKGILLGIVSVCYLGAPYEVHTLDVSGEIIEHFKKGCSLTGGMEKARAIAIRGGYEFIEVYVDCCRAVSSSGAVSVIPG